MYNIRCTAKLIKRARLPVESSVSESSTALGDWYANLLFFQRAQYLLFVSETSRLAVITPAKDAKHLSMHLNHHLPVLLTQLGSPSEWIDAEVREMSEVHFANTKSRSVLGTMNDYKYQVEAMYFSEGEVRPLEMAMDLSVCPVGPLQYRCPGEVAVDLLRMRYGTVA